MPGLTKRDMLSIQLHDLYEQTLVSLHEGRTYETFVLMSERSRYLLEWLELYQDSDLKSASLIYSETEEVQTQIGLAIENLTNSLAHLIQTKPARKAYASSVAIGEIANHLLRHRED